MTDYFEVHERDGPARLGELRLTDPLHTPALVDAYIEDAGSRWFEAQEMPDGNEEVLTVLPHRSFPAGTATEVKEAFEVEYPSVDFPSAAVISHETAQTQDHDYDSGRGQDRGHGSDAYILSSASGLAGHAERFVETIIDVRESLPADVAILLSGVATPANVATLSYAGVDLFDSDRAYVRGLEGFYLTTDGEAFLEDLTELPCACSACKEGREEFDRECCAEHNVNALETELTRVRERIRAGRLRDYIEGQARHDAWLTALFRRLDQQYAYTEQRTPLIRRNTLLAASDDSMRRVEIQRFAERVCTRYRNRFEQPLVLVPCSARKPYSESQSHGQFHDAIHYRAHKVSVTSPIGVVPQELEYTYPAQHYDSVVTGRWSTEEVDFVARVLTQYLARNDYPHYIAHVPPGGYREICERVEDEAGIEFEYTVTDHPTTTNALDNLRDALGGESKYLKREREHNTVRAIADYQLGADAGTDLFGEFSVEGWLPSLRVHNDEQLATIVPQYGTLAFTLAGANQWLESEVPTKRVEIDPFVPQGSVLAPGVVDATADIRTGDEVVIEGPRAFAVGRAAMNGPEMKSSTRGIAVEVRHVEERR